MSEYATPTLSQVVETFHGLYPLDLAQEWDASGLVLGRAEQKVAKVVFAVDPVWATVKQALDWGADLLITHHPLLLRGAKFLADTSYKGRLVHSLIEGGCALLAAHTNADSAQAGVNEALAQALGLTDLRVLAEESVQYRDGQSYSVGLGRIGQLDQTRSLYQLAQQLAELLPATAAGLRVAGDPQGLVKTVALCAGAGDSLLDLVQQAQVDAYITADLRHHPASEFREQALCQKTGKPFLLDCSLYASEWLWLKTGAQELERALALEGYGVKTQVCQLNTDPWDFWLATGELTASASSNRFVS